jgi:hypothetical protein
LGPGKEFTVTCDNPTVESYCESLLDLLMEERYTALRFTEHPPNYSKSAKRNNEDIAFSINKRKKMMHQNKWFLKQTAAVIIVMILLFYKYSFNSSLLLFPHFHNLNVILFLH